MLNISVVILYNNVGVMFKGSNDMASKGIENWPLSTSPCQLTPPHASANIRISLTAPETRVPREHFCRWQCRIFS